MDDDALELLRRNSGLRLDRDGVFHFHGGLVESPRVQALFHRGLSVRRDGEVVLRVGEQWAYVKCEGVSRFVERLRGGAGGLEVTVRGAVDMVVCVEPQLGFAPDDRCYLWDGQGGDVAVLLRPAHHALASLLVSGPDGEPVVAIGERRLRVATLRRVPLAGERLATVVA